MQAMLAQLKHACLGALTPVRVQVWKLNHAAIDIWDCPICGYRGVFFEENERKNAKCPKCYGLERHRLQWLTVTRLASRKNLSSMRMLHFAPEHFLSVRFRALFKEYETADLNGRNVNYTADLTDLPFADASYDCVYASHVLEHVRDDRAALANIRRVLKPDGFAILPVPMFAGTETVEYPEANPHEAYHVRQPGHDYYERYKPYFSKIEFYKSGDFPSAYQLHIYEDRSQWPTPLMPHKRPMPGYRHEDIVPVCYA